MRDNRPSVFSEGLRVANPVLEDSCDRNAHHIVGPFASRPPHAANKPSGLTTMWDMHKIMTLRNGSAWIRLSRRLLIQNHLCKPSISGGFSLAGGHTQNR